MSSSRLFCMRRKYTVERYRQKLRGSNRLRSNPDSGFGKTVADEALQRGAARAEAHGYTSVMGGSRKIAGKGVWRPGLSRPVERDVLTGPVLRRECETETLARSVVRAAPGGDLAGADLRPGRIDRLHPFAGRRRRPGQRLGPPLDPVGNFRLPVSQIVGDLKGDRD